MTQAAPHAASGHRLRPPRRASSPASPAQQIKEQKRRYANAVLRSLARTQSGRPTIEVQRLLSDSLKPLGLRLPPAKLHDLAIQIASGQATELPS